MKFTAIAIAAVLAISSPPLSAGPLKRATVSHIVNDVQVIPLQGKLRRAAEREILNDDASVRVGARSRVELVFDDQTIARLGAETSMKSLPGKRTLLLDRGTLLLQVPTFRGGATIRTGALKIACCGATILVEHLPGKSLKAVVLEGEMRVSVDRFLGDSIVVPAGKMLITNADVTRIPDPVDTDLRTLVMTSALINPTAFRGVETGPEIAPLPSLPRIMQAIARQESALNAKRLIRTNLVIFGSGTNVVIPGASEAPATSQNPENADRRTAEIAVSPMPSRQLAVEPALPEP